MTRAGLGYGSPQAILLPVVGPCEQVVRSRCALRGELSGSHSDLPAARSPGPLGSCFAEVGMAINILTYLDPCSLIRISVCCSQFRSVSEHPTTDAIWMPFYENRYFINPKFARQEALLRPPQIYACLETLSISGKWHVRGLASKGPGGEPFSPYKYEYFQHFHQGRRHHLSADFSGEVEFISPTESVGEEAFSVHGKVDGNCLVMHESIRSKDDPTGMIAVNICSAVVSLDGQCMAGVWTQHAPSHDGVLGAGVSSGTFEARRCVDST
mmetsp:Transcript_6539/g.14107  ORF Transcript_6539/g.14107 Transcript_6539/m.14107 type:complete len:269 (+) Transcript_6539:32-838(+)